LDRLEHLAVPQELPELEKAFADPFDLAADQQHQRPPDKPCRPRVDRQGQSQDRCAEPFGRGVGGAVGHGIKLVYMTYLGKGKMCGRRIFVACHRHPRRRLAAAGGSSCVEIPVNLGIPVAGV